MSDRKKQREEAHRLLDRYLDARRQRRTPERFAILDEIYASDEHLDADELFRRLEESGFRVSRATVYNTLELLVDSGLVVRQQLAGRHAVFERAFGYRQHDHLICTDCGKVFEFCDPRMQGIREMVGDVFESEIVHHALVFHGHCIRFACPNRPSDDT